jgi:hypothetical protein
MRAFIIAASIVLYLTALAGSAEARCVCRCVDGEMQPLCSNALDIAPPCMGICGPVAPSIAPLAPLTLPPLGTTDCRMAQVCNGFGNCGWQRVCE